MTHLFRPAIPALLGLATVLAACTGPAPTVNQPAASPTIAPATAQSVPTTAPAGAATRPPATTAPVTASPATASPAPQVQAPVCGPSPALTVAQTEGPYFKANAPRRSSLIEPGLTGTKLIMTGFVLTTSCQPVRNAVVDFWQADDKGQYDNTGFKLRGNVVTDETGRYTIETIMPGLYPGRTRHVHVKIRLTGQQELTTQLYFPNEPQNQRDSIFDQRLVVTMQDTGGSQTASFNFIVRV